jgi:hypothetical protein
MSTLVVSALAMHGGLTRSWVRLPSRLRGDRSVPRKGRGKSELTTVGMNPRKRRGAARLLGYVQIWQPSVAWRTGRERVREILRARSTRVLR